jgi:hypothetical protein
MNRKGIPTRTDADVGEPVLSADFARRVVQLARDEQRRRRNRLGIAVFTAFAFTSALAFHLMRNVPVVGKSEPQAVSLAAGERNASSQEETGWPLGWDVTVRTAGRYFFPDLDSLTNSTSEYQAGSAPSLDSVLGFDESGTVQAL